MTESVSDASTQLVSPVIRGLRLLRYIAQGGNTGNLSEVGRLIDVNRVTVMRLLATLEHEGMIERLPQGGHRIGVDFLTMAAAGLGSSDLVETGRRFLLRLCEGLGLSAYLVVMDGNDAVYVAREMPESGLVSHIRVGSRVAAHLTAPGRSMLAVLPPKEIEQRFARLALAPINDKGPSNLKQLKALLEQDGKQGCAWSFSGYEVGINACAAAVCDASGAAVGAISVVGPEHLFTRDEAFIDKVQAQVMLAASELSLIIGGRDNRSV
jgi:DNA-binding IclR family transcriptional regulator